MDILFQKQTEIRLLKTRLQVLETQQPDPAQSLPSEDQTIRTLEQQNRQLQAAIQLLLARKQEFAQLQVLRGQMNEEARRNLQLTQDKTSIIEEMRALRAQIEGFEGAVLGGLERTRHQDHLERSDSSVGSDQECNLQPKTDIEAHAKLVQSCYIRPTASQENSEPRSESQSESKLNASLKQPRYEQKQNKKPCSQEYQVKIYSSLESWRLNQARRP